jgi:Rps23 Pro-64 3,4-dihydroxylase Tpa1-like proline 4-hydroxylase
VLDVAKLEDELAGLQERYLAARPFPHIVLDDFLPPDVAKVAIEAFPSLNSHEWNNYLHANERKFSNTQSLTWPAPLQALLAELQSKRFVDLLSGLTGIDGLFADETLEGGGLHQSVAGGFLNIHADFTVHPRHRSWRRRVNLLLYLNGDWPEAYGGDLEMWSTDMSRCEDKIRPVGNRVVIFSTDADSFHGHPEPMQCPPGVARQSLALYYFTTEVNPLVRSTEYRARPGEGSKGVVIYLDKQALRVYDWTKRHLGMSDASVTKILRTFEHLRRKKH